MTPGRVRFRPPPPSPNHFAAITDKVAIGEVLRKARAADPAKGVARAHVLLVFSALRIREAIGAQWFEFDLDRGVWAVPRSRMKRRDAERGDHLVPLPRQVVADLKAWKTADGDGATFVCPALRDPERTITPEGVEKFYRDVLGLGDKHSPHSWRSTLKTICADAGKNREAIESALDHVVGNKVEAAYDRAHRFELRRPLMQWYADTLIAARDGADVIAMNSRK